MIGFCYQLTYVESQLLEGFRLRETKRLLPSVMNSIIVKLSNKHFKN